MRITCLRSYLFVLLFILFAISCKKDDFGDPNYDQEILEEVNKHRESIGLRALEYDNFLWILAREHSIYMADNETSSNHDGMTERVEAIREYFGGGEVTENVARGTGGSAQEVVQTWLASISHKANIEGNYTLSAISAVKSDNGSWYYTQIFFK